LEEIAILKMILNDPSITQKEMAKHLGKSERSIKTRTVELQEKDYIHRVNGKEIGSGKYL